MAPPLSTNAYRRGAEIGALLGRRFPDAKSEAIGWAVLCCRAAALAHDKFMVDETNGVFSGPLAAGNRGRRVKHFRNLRNRAALVLGDLRHSTQGDSLHYDTVQIVIVYAESARERSCFVLAEGDEVIAVPLI